MKIDFYKNKLNKTVEEINILQKSFNNISLIRFIIFLIALCVFCIAITQKISFLYILTIIFFALFIILIRKHIKIENELKYKNAEKIVLEKYISRFSEDWRLFNCNGKEFLSNKIPQAKDLDILGQNSLYQYICVANTAYGKQLLANNLQNIKPKRNAIIKHQQAVEELSNKIEFSIRMQSLGTIFSTNKKNKDAIILDFLKISENKIKSSPLLLKIYIWLLPAITISILIFSILNKQASFLFITCILIQLASTFIGYARNIKELKPIEEFTEQINAYVAILKLIEDEKFNSQYINELQKILNKDGSAVSSLKHLNSICEFVKGRRNSIEFILTNGLFLSDYHLVEQFNKWKRIYGKNIRKWLEVVGEIEMLLSLAVICNVKDEYCFPTIKESSTPILSFNQIKHPLITETKSVGNDINLNSSTCIITGSNMSGKTTFMRSIGTNILLAYSGAPVLATSFEISEIALFTSIRIEDSVTENISTFYAELLRLKDIIDYSKKGLPMITLIDEIFKGTNSSDRIIGAIETIKRLSKDKIITILTTHDFELCDLEKNKNVCVINYHFSENYINDKINFDYKIKTGRCKTTNAQYLLKMVGIL